MSEFITSPFFIDLVVLTIFLISTTLACFKGLTREFISLAVWVGSFALTIIFYEDTQFFFSKFIDQPDLIKPISFSFSFTATLIVLSIIGFILSFFVKRFLPKTIDSAGGFIWGMIRGIFIPCLLYFMIIWINDAGGGKLIPNNIVQSRTYPLIAKISETGIGLIPKSFFEK